MPDATTPSDATSSPVAGLEIPANRKEARAVLLRAVAADHGWARGMTLFELVAAAVHYGLRTSDERENAIAQSLSESSATASA
jgi:hypothetical protein